MYQFSQDYKYDLSHIKMCNSIKCQQLSDVYNLKESYFVLPKNFSWNKGNFSIYQLTWFLNVLSWGNSFYEEEFYSEPITMHKCKHCLYYKKIVLVIRERPALSQFQSLMIRRSAFYCSLETSCGIF